MGTFWGHALPGTFLILYAVWWTIQIFRRYYQSLMKGGMSFKSTVTFPCSCCCGRAKHWEWEGFFKIVFTVIGFTGEVITAHKDGHFVHMGNGQHATMFFFFGMSGVVDILVHHRLPLPKAIEYLMMTLAFVVEALLFMFHLHGRTKLDVLVHTLMLYAVYANVLACLAEMRYRKNVLSPLTRTYFMFLQGTWFWQLGFILYRPLFGKWDEDSEEQMMVATLIFAWHMAGVFIFMLIIGAFIGCIYRCRGDLTSPGEYDSLQMQLIKRDPNGHTIVSLHDDSESDIDFERPLTHNTE